MIYICFTVVACKVWMYITVPAKCLPLKVYSEGMQGIVNISGIKIYSAVNKFRAILGVKWWETDVICKCSQHMQLHVESGNKVFECSAEAKNMS